ncbi:DUF2510 domain-containing protein, partial [Streptacidiphilus griseoplanus]|uniref:DUF2510 domain-containing protein n=1 Tax=Peterkaempfera griseoplana TaxID=66896 RepID=UPI001FE1A767
MTDRPSSGSTAGAAPAPGYYPDPSIPGFVRYWDGAAWAPGTTRPAPEPGEVLAPPRLVARRQTPPMRPVPPPETPGEEPAAGAAPGRALPVRRGWAGPAALEESGPVFFDETTGGTSFTTEPRPAPVGPPLASPAPWSAPPLPVRPAVAQPPVPQPADERPAVPQSVVRQPVAPQPEGAEAGPAEPGVRTAPGPAMAAEAPADRVEGAGAPAPGPHDARADARADAQGNAEAEAAGIEAAVSDAEPGRPPEARSGRTEPDRAMRPQGTDDRDNRSGWQADVRNQRGLMESQAA